MTETVIRGGTIIDQAGERSGDVVIGDDGRIRSVGPDLSAERVVDAAGCIVAPGLVAILWSGMFDRFEPLDVRAMMKTNVELLFALGRRP